MLEVDVTDDVVRRSVALPAQRTKDIKLIKKNTGAKTDTAAINQAVEFRARLASRGLDEIERALRLWDVVRNEIEDGDRLVILSKSCSLNSAQRAQAKILVPV